MSNAFRNIGWALASAVSNAAINLVAVPFYLHFLGTEAYGLIGFYITLQALSQILDLGLASTVNREIARSSGKDTRLQAADLLHTLAVACVGISVLIAATVFVAAPWIAGRWFATSSIPVSTVAQAVALMGLNLAVRWPVSLFQGAINGSHRLALSSAVNMISSIGAAAATISIIALVSRTIQAFFLVQISFGLLQVVALGWFAFKVAGFRGSRFRVETVRQVWRFSAGMGAIALTSLVFTQLDKALLSRLVGLERFGEYMLAVLVVSGLQVVVVPVFNTIYPRFSSLVAEGKFEQLAADYAVGTRLAGALLFPLAATLVFHGQAIVSLWTGNPSLATSVAPLVAILAVGSALNGIMYFPYALQLAFGKPRVPLAINAGLLILIAPLIILLAMTHGARGGATAWALVGLVYVVVGTWATGRHVMREAGWRWLLNDVAVPLSVSVFVIASGALVGRGLWSGPWTETTAAAFAALVAVLSCVLLDAKSRHIAGAFASALAQGIAAKLVAGRQA